MEALDTLFRPVIAMINRQIAAKTPARELCRELDGRVFAIRVTNTALTLYVEMNDGVLSARGSGDDEPDVVLAGSLFSLARLAGPAGDALIRDGDVDIAGDAVIAQRFQRLLRYGRPDLEEELSGVIGDVPAHRVGEFLRGTARWLADTRRTMTANVDEYLREESGTVPGRHEVDAFRESVNTLRDDVARFEARLGALERERR